MKRLVLVALVACMPVTVHADWSASHKNTQAAYTTFHVIDWLQTREIASRPEYDEVNPILGRNPSRRDVDVYFSITLLGHYLLADYLSPYYRSAFQRATLSMQVTVTAHNYRAGVKLRW